MRFLLVLPFLLIEPVHSTTVIPPPKDIPLECVEIVSNLENEISENIQLVFLNKSISLLTKTLRRLRNIAIEEGALVLQQELDVEIENQLLSIKDHENLLRHFSFELKEMSDEFNANPLLISDDDNKELASLFNKI